MTAEQQAILLWVGAGTAVIALISALYKILKAVVRSDQALAGIPAFSSKLEATTEQLREHHTALEQLKEQGRASYKIVDELQDLGRKVDSLRSELTFLGKEVDWIRARINGIPRGRGGE